jgi:hypothetical protein
MKKPFIPLKNVYISLYEGDKLSALKAFIDTTKIKKINKGVETNGTSLKGYVKTTFDNIVSKLGEPSYNDMYDKILANWAIEFEDGLIVTIYIYKLSYIPKEVYNWHIGGPYGIFHKKKGRKWKEVVNKMATGTMPLLPNVTKDMIDNVTRYSELTELPLRLRFAISNYLNEEDDEEILQRVSSILNAPVSKDYF